MLSPSSKYTYLSLRWLWKTPSYSITYSAKLYNLFLINASFYPPNCEEDINGEDIKVSSIIFDAYFNLLYINVAWNNSMDSILIISQINRCY